MKANSVKLWLLGILASLLMSWALLLPFGGIADEPAYWHYGIDTANNVFHNQEMLRKGDIDNISSSTCFAFKPDVTAKCQNFTEDSTLIVAKPALLNYPKLTYLFTAWPAFIWSGENAMLLSRIASTLLCLILIGFGIAHWQRSTKKLILAIFFALPALSIHLIASYNPNGIEIASLLAFSLMLFGRNKSSDKEIHSWKWWISFIVVTIFASSGKPLSGLFVLLIVFMYFLLNVRNRNEIKIANFNVLVKSNTSLFVAACLTTIVSIVLSMDSLRKANALSSNGQRPDLIQTGWNFLLKSEPYFYEYAGIFGWRDTGTAPWTLLIWILSSFMVIYFAFKSSERNERKKIIFVWIGITLIFPLIESLLLANSFNVGLQTRYLSGLFAFVAVYTVTLIDDKFLNKIPQLIILLVVINLLNLAWNYFRYSIGVSSIYSWEAFLFGIIDADSWRPTYFLIGVFFVTLVLLLLTLIPKSLKITPENEPKRRKIAGIYLIALTFIAASNLNMSKAGELPKLIPGISISNPDKPVGELIKGVVVSQSFTAELDGLRKIDVLAATYARKNFGKLEIEVYEENKEIIFREVRDVSKIADNLNLSILIPNQPSSKSKKYVISFTSTDGAPGNAVTFWQNSTNPYRNGEARIGSEVLGDLAFTLYYEKK
jgi:hypothetical protein